MRRILPALALACALAVPTAHAETRVVVPGTLPSGTTLEKWDAESAVVGANWLPGTTAQVVGYPSALWPVAGHVTLGASIATGQQNLDAYLRQQDGPVTVVGISQGAMVIDAELARGTVDPTKVTFVLMADPNRGVMNLFPAGTYIPILNTTVTAPPVTKYDTVVVYGQYDGLGDFPDRPWNLLADANALFGLAYVHAQTAYAAQSDAVEMSSTTNELGGHTTTYMVPTKELPLTEPLRSVLPDATVDEIDKVLRPMIDAGYSQYSDSKAPYIKQGRLVFPGQSAATRSTGGGATLVSRLKSAVAKLSHLKPPKVKLPTLKPAKAKLPTLKLPKKKPAKANAARSAAGTDAARDAA